jgi:hypothetical protein
VGGTKKNNNPRFASQKSQGLKKIVLIKGFFFRFSEFSESHYKKI